LIERELNPDDATGRFILRPHRSATWRQDLWLIAAIAAVALPLAAVWAVVGFWLILPLALLQIALVLAAFWVSSHSLLAREVVTLEPERIVIEAGHRRPERRFELQRPWARVQLRRGPRALQRRQLVIRCRQRAVECGRFLTEAEREELWRDLRALLAQAPAQP
jgi:uncharacterized membrane protein